MNKLKSFALLVGLMLVGSTVLAYNSPESIGIIKQVIGADQQTPVRVYKLVRNPNRAPNASSMAVGTAVAYDTVSDDGVTVNTSTTAGFGAAAGIIVTSIPTDDSAGDTSAADDVGRRNWGYVQVHGPVDSATITSGSTVAAGDAMYLSSDAGVVGNQGVVTSTTTQAKARPFGFFYDAAGPADTGVQVFVVAE